MEESLHEMTTAENLCISLAIPHVRRRHITYQCASHIPCYKLTKRNSYLKLFKLTIRNRVDATPHFGHIEAVST